MTIVSYDEAGWKTRGKLIKHIRWDVRQARLAAWALEKPLPAGLEVCARVAAKLGDWMDPSRSGPPPETPWQYKIQKSLHRDSADARKTALEWRRKATEFRKKAANHHERAAELETEITKWMSGKDWG